MDASPLEPTPPTSESESLGEITMATTSLSLYCAQLMCSALITQSVHSVQHCTQITSPSSPIPPPPRFLCPSSVQRKGKAQSGHLSQCSPCQAFTPTRGQGGGGGGRGGSCREQCQEEEDGEESCDR